MNTIVAYPDNLSFTNGKYHHSSDNYKQRNTFSNLDEFDLSLIHISEPTRR